MLNFNFPKYKPFLLELKYKFGYSFLMFCFTLISCYLNIYPILYLFSKYLLSQINSSKFFFSNIFQIFFLYIEISVYISLPIVFPFIILNFFQYFIPSLYKKEIDSWSKVLFFTTFWLIFSIFFTYFYLFPQFLKFFLLFETTNNFIPIFFEAKIDEYFIFLFNLFFKCICFFQLPTIIYFLMKLHIISLNTCFKKRNYIYLFILLISALINPPEIFTQIIFLIFFLCCYEIFFYLLIFYITIKNCLKFLE